MSYGIFMIIVGAIVALGSCWKGNKAADDGNIASVLWNFPLFIMGAMAFGIGLELVWWT